jgi:hypothetical protein
MLIYNPRHLLAVLSEFVAAHYNEHRPNQSRDQRPPDATETRPAVVDLDGARIRRQKILNGLINEYSQRSRTEFSSGTGRVRRADAGVRTRPTPSLPLSLSR